MNMKTINLIWILLIIGPAELFAQQPIKAIVGAGPDKIYVNLGNELLSRSIPFNDAVQYRIERKQAPENSWKQLAEIETALSLSEFKNNLVAAMKVVPNPASIKSIPVENIWKRVETYRRLDSLKFWGMALPVRIALGITYIDSDVKPGVMYEYRISKIDSKGSIISQVRSFPAAFPASVNFIQPKLVLQEARQNKITLKWKADAGKRPSSFACFRQDQLKGDFVIIVPPHTILTVKDSLFFILSDTLVSPMSVYRYYILPMDFYGNTGVASDTALVANYDFRSIPLPDKISTVSLDSLGGIRLTWHVSDPAKIKSLKIFRSMQWEKGYEQIAEVSAETEFYVDQNVEPMVKYFYYVNMIGAFGEESAPSAKTFGIFQSALKPVRPWILKYEGTKTGVRLELAAPEKNVAGYRVYRGIEGQDISLVTDLVPKNDSITIFVDTDTTLSGKLQYGYTVRAENVSHRMSDYSDTVFVRPLKSTGSPVPRDLTADVENDVVQLYWLDMQPFDQTLDGYFVYRREFSEKNPLEFKKITERPIGAQINRYKDTIALEGKIFEYAVQSIDIFGSVSKLSNPVRIHVQSQAPIPPEGVRAQRTSEGVLVQWDETIQKDAAGFNVYRYEREKKHERVASLKLKELEFTDKKIHRGNLYFYYVTCVDSKKVESSPSREISIRP
jgi:fibronectin type 3 domain-containing protein